MPDLLPVARIVGFFGLHGELKLDPTPAGEPLFAVGATFQVRVNDGTESVVEVASLRRHQRRYLVSFVDYQDRTSVESLLGATLYAERKRLEANLEPDELLDVELIGMQLVDRQGTLLGPVVAVEHYPASPMLVVGAERRLVPFVKAFIDEVNRHTRTLHVDLPIGLLGDDTAESE